MSDAAIIAVGSAELGVTDVAETAKFFTETWGLRTVAEEDGVHYLRGTGPIHHIVALHPRARPELVRINLEAANREAVDALCARVRETGINAIEGPAPIARPGGGYGFAFRDPEGRNIGIVTGINDHGDIADDPDRPRKISHVVLTSGEADRTVDFFTGVLGFKIADRTRMLNFLRCNNDHHSIAFANGDDSALHHIAFEMPDLDSVMRGASRMREAGWQIDWGVGRHGPGNNVFSYFVGPNDMLIEYTAEVMQIDDSYKAGGPDDWGFPPGRTDQWGVTDPPSGRIKAVSGKVTFQTELALAG